MRRIAATMLSALLVSAGVPGSAGATALQGGACGMTCCKRDGGGMDMAAHAGMAPHTGHVGTAAPAPPAPTAESMSPPAPAGAPSAPPNAARCSWRCGHGQEASFAEALPSMMPAPMRLPAPASTARGWQRTDSPATLLYLELPKPPPRA